jgi:hypothetical protein
MSNEDRHSRSAVLTELINGKGSIEYFRDRLRDFKFDSDFIVVLKSENIINILSEFIEGNITDEYVENWAEIIEVRDDIGFDEKNDNEIKQAIHDLANPILSGTLNKEMAIKICHSLQGP